MYFRVLFQPFDRSYLKMSLFVALGCKIPNYSFACKNDMAYSIVDVALNPSSISFECYKYQSTRVLISLNVPCIYFINLS